MSIEKTIADLGGELVMGKGVIRTARGSVVITERNSDGKTVLNKAGKALVAEKGTAPKKEAPAKKPAAKKTATKKSTAKKK